MMGYSRRTRWSRHGPERVTYEKLRAYAREGLRRLATMHGVPLTDGQQAKTTARNVRERVDIVPAENSDVMDEDEEVKEVRHLSL
jgi:hypothetical protein